MTNEAKIRQRTALNRLAKAVVYKWHTIITEEVKHLGTIGFGKATDIAIDVKRDYEALQTLDAIISMEDDTEDDAE